MQPSVLGHYFEEFEEGETIVHSFQTYLKVTIIFFHF